MNARRKRMLSFCDIYFRYKIPELESTLPVLYLEGTVIYPSESSQSRHYHRDRISHKQPRDTRTSKGKE
jgi:hypothetical protein